MTQDHLEVSGVFPASPEAIYDAFLDGSKHTAMTGAPATASAEAGGRFTAWDGYIEGENLQLDRPRRILQRWRASDFPEGSASSLLEVRLDPEGSGTRVVIRHADLPEGSAGRYTEGWTKFYFAPMSVYFGETPESAEDYVVIDDTEIAEIVDEDDEEAVSVDDATARKDTGSAPVDDPTEGLRDAARAEDEDDAEESSQRSEVDGAIRSLWESAVSGDVAPDLESGGSSTMRLRERGAEIEVEELEEHDEDDELRTPTMRAPAHAEWAPHQEPTGVRGLAVRALRAVKGLAAGEPKVAPPSDATKPAPRRAVKKAKIEKIALPDAPPEAPAKKAAPKKAAPKKAAPKKAAPKKTAKKAALKKAAPKKAALKKAAPKKAAKKVAPKKAAKKVAPKKAAKKAAPKKKATTKAGPKKAVKKAAPKKKAAARPKKKAAPRKAAARKGAKRR